jgi:predicted dithiol-disulfide oxidoreductase (DUF899 family)
MPSYKSKKDAEKALKRARDKLAATRNKMFSLKIETPERKKYEDLSAKHLKECREIQHVLDRWDALHS